MALYHAAMEVHLEGVRYVVELAPVPDRGGAATRGVVAGGPVGIRFLGHLRWFRYELRRWTTSVRRQVDVPLGGGPG